jgi:hypothetical protein
LYDNVPDAGTVFSANVYFGLEYFYPYREKFIDFQLYLIVSYPRFSHISIHFYLSGMLYSLSGYRFSLSSDRFCLSGYRFYFPGYRFYLSDDRFCLSGIYIYSQ